MSRRSVENKGSSIAAHGRIQEKIGQILNQISSSAGRNIIQRKKNYQGDNYHDDGSSFQAIHASTPYGRKREISIADKTHVMSDWCSMRRENSTLHLLSGASTPQKKKRKGRGSIS
jgi:hypothetical protein